MPPLPPPCGTQAQTVRRKDNMGGCRFDSSTIGNKQIEVPAVRGLPDLTCACMKQAEDPTGPPYWPQGQKGPVQRVVPSSEVPQQPLQPLRPPPPANNSRINQVTLESTTTVRCSRRHRHRHQRQTNQRILANDEEQLEEGAAAAATERVGAKQEPNIRSPRCKLHKYVERKRCPFLPQNHDALKNMSVFATKTMVPSKMCPVFSKKPRCPGQMSVFTKKLRCPGKMSVFYKKTRFPGLLGQM